MAHLSLGISYDDAEKRAREQLFSGAALSKFKDWISAQGGDTSFIDNTDKFESAKYKKELKCHTDGFVCGMDAEKIGLAAMELGAGRKTKEDKIDYAAGIILAKKTGDKVKRGDTLATLYSSKLELIEDAERVLSCAYKFSDTPRENEKLIYKILL